MIKILALIPIDYDQTSFYRGMEPLKRLQQKYPTLLNIMYLTGTQYQNIGWAQISDFDIIFMQRPQESAHMLFIDKCKDMGKKLWFDYDDDLINVPTHHVMYEFYSQEHRLKRIKDIWGFADVITVTNQALADIISEKNKNVAIIPNALNDIMLSGYKPVLGENTCVTWRGSSTHENDVYTFKDQIIAAARANPDWTFNFIGDRFSFIYREIRNHRYFEAMDTPKYFKTLHELNSAVHIVPLYNDKFNQSKSNIAWLESTWAGSVCLCPDFPSWSDAIMRYKTEDDFSVFLHDLTDDEPQRKHLWERDIALINEKYLLSKINDKRLEVIQKLIDG